VLADGPSVNPANVGRICGHGVVSKVVSTNICGSDQHVVRGLYVTDDPGGIDEDAKIGSLRARLELGWAKSETFTTRQWSSTRTACCVVVGPSCVPVKPVSPR